MTRKEAREWLKDNMLKVTLPYWVDVIADRIDNIVDEMAPRLALMVSDREDDAREAARQETDE